MDLVEEQDRAAPVLTETLPGPLDAVAYVLDAGGDGRHLLEGAFGRPRHGQRQRGLAGARRAPEDGRCQPIELDQATERTAGTDEVLLSDASGACARSRSATAAENKSSGTASRYRASHVVSVAR